MTKEEKIICYETLKHIKNVSDLLNIVVAELLSRAKNHDQSKLEDPELSTFVEYTPKLAETTYGSEQYQQYLNEMKFALDHHYGHNRHHPEYFEMEADATFRASPINCMNLIDVLEMLCDWMAATKRHNDGDIYKSIEINKKRFGLSDQLTAILKNTVKVLGG